MFSCLYEGMVRHRRYLPKAHGFENKLFYTFIDLDELTSVFSGRWLWSVHRFNIACMKRADYLGDPKQNLKEAVLDHVQAQTGIRPIGPVRLFTHLRYFGFVFNPVSFYFCYDATGEHVQTIVAEITNTPWGQRHAYVLPVEQSVLSTKFQFSFDKQFHVSPFMPMDIHYEWYFTAPAEHFTVHMINFQGEAKIFDATLSMQRKAITSAHCAAALLRFPLVTLKVVTLIYWHALRLWLKKVPFYNHPQHTTPVKGDKPHEQ